LKKSLESPQDVHAEEKDNLDYYQK